MKRYLYRIYSKMQFLLCVWKWSVDTIRLRKQITTKEKKINKIEGKLVILIPHADDEWVGCSQFLSDDKMEVILLNMDMQGGDDSYLHTCRRAELKKIANTYNRELINIDEKKEESLRHILKETSPDFICLPYFFDWHPEHVAVMNDLFHVFGDFSYKGSVLMYQVSLPILPEECNYWISMNKKQWKMKWRVFEDIYKSQIGIPYKRFAYNERINGAISGDYAAEIYKIIPADIWREKFSTFLLDEGEIDKVKASLMDITETRKELRRFLTKRNKKVREQ